MMIQHLRGIVPIFEQIVDNFAKKRVECAWGGEVVDEGEGLRLVSATARTQRFDIEQLKNKIQNGEEEKKKEDSSGVSQAMSIEISAEVSEQALLIKLETKYCFFWR